MSILFIFVVVTHKNMNFEAAPYIMVCYLYVFLRYYLLIFYIAAYQPYKTFLNPMRDKAERRDKTVEFTTRFAAARATT